MKRHALFLVVGLSACQSVTGNDANVTRYTGHMRGILLEYHSAGQPGCHDAFLTDADFTVTLAVGADSSVSGKFDSKGTSVKNGNGCSSGQETRGFDWNMDVNGTTSHMSGSEQHNDQTHSSFSFTGAMSGNNLNLTINFSEDGTIQTSSGPDRITGSMSGEVVLER